MNYINKRIADLKHFWDNETLLGPTDEEMRCYRPPVPLTDAQKQALEGREHERRLEADQRAKMEESWRIRRYEGTTDKEEKLW